MKLNFFQAFQVLRRAENNCSLYAAQCVRCHHHYHFWYFVRLFIQFLSLCRNMTKNIHFKLQNLSCAKLFLLERKTSMLNQFLKSFNRMENIFLNSKHASFKVNPLYRHLIMFGIRKLVLPTFQGSFDQKYENLVESEDSFKTQIGLLTFKFITVFKNLNFHK